MKIIKRVWHAFWIAFLFEKFSDIRSFAQKEKFYKKYNYHVTRFNELSRKVK